VKKVISCSLWGSSPEYLDGALLALSGIRDCYPGWEAWFYIRNDVPKDAVARLRECGAVIREVPYEQPYHGMVLRFLPASDPSVDVFLSRDCDSRITVREAEAVREWLRSEKNVHIIRDHPNHILPMMGGLWGCRRGVLADMDKMIGAYGDFRSYGCDQKFLARHVYPRIRNDAFVHSEVIRLSGESVHPLPVPRGVGEFIGRANRTVPYQDQDQALCRWIEDGGRIRTVPNIYTPMGRLWLIGKTIVDRIRSILFQGKGSALRVHDHRTPQSS